MLQAGGGSKSFQNWEQDQDPHEFLGEIMKLRITDILLVPTKDQVYDNISFKLGAFHQRFGQSTFKGLKQSTRKAGEIVKLAQKMKRIPRQVERLIKVCSYARQIKKFHYKNYKKWKQYIWADLQHQEKKMMENYVQNLTPPEILKGQDKPTYQKREEKILFEAYKDMTIGMLLVEIFEKIWTIRKYRQDKKQDDVQRHKELAIKRLERIKEVCPKLRGHMCANMGREEWKEISDKW